MTTTKEIVAKYKELGDSEKVAEFFNLADSTIKKHLRRAGVITPPDELYACRVQDIASQYKPGESIRKLARRLDKSENTIRRALYAAGALKKAKQGRTRKPEPMAQHEARESQYGFRVIGVWQERIGAHG